MLGRRQSSIRIDHDLPSTVPSRSSSPPPPPASAVAPAPANGNEDEKVALAALLKKAKPAAAPPEFDMSSFAF